MSYEATIENIFQRKPKKGAGHEEFWRALELWNHPQTKYPSVHITGTNGKGQVAVKIARALEKGGYKVGLFISPHLFAYEERISINGKRISQETVEHYDRELVALMETEGLRLNFFECTSAFGFRYFEEQNVDIAVVEVGVGGRLDSTNILQPLVSIITSISPDHLDVLGTTVEKIAQEKAGIIKTNTPVVVGPRAKLLPVFREAEAKNAPVHVVERQSCFYDTENQATAKEALQLIAKRLPLSQTAMDEGVRESLPCRFEKRGRVIYDVAHNPDGMERLSDALEHLYPNRKFRFLIGMGSNKDIKGSLAKIKDQVSHIHFVKAAHPQSASQEVLASAWKELSLAPCSIEASVREGAEKAKSATQKGEILVVCGSFHIMADAY